jgi:hypothetical protein
VARGFYDEGKLEGRFNRAEMLMRDLEELDDVADVPQQRSLV